MTSAPTAWQIEQAVSAFHRAQAADVNMLLPDVDDAALQRPAQLLTRIMDGYAWARNRADEADAMRRAFKERRDRFVRRAERLLGFADSLMQILNLPRHASPLARAGYRPTKPAPLITDAALLADRFIRRVPHLPAIREALEAGEVVEGAVLSNSQIVLRITRLAVPVTAAMHDDDDEP